MSVTAKQAKAEIVRRALPKSSPARKVYPPAAVMTLTGAQLAILAGPPVEAPKAPKVADPMKALRASVVKATCGVWSWAAYNATAGLTEDELRELIAS